jgi:hypothetical protein
VLENIWRNKQQINKQGRRMAWLDRLAEPALVGLFSTYFAFAKVKIQPKG